MAIAVLDPSGKLVYQLHAETKMPVASAIKSAILLEFFSKYRHDLSATPKEAPKILSDPKHPALAHFSVREKKEIATALAGASVKRLGHIMIDRHDESGSKYSSVTYNAATNLAIALLGGPAETTQAIHTRDPAFAGITVNRYMLADRKTTGDNTATPLALASLHQKISSRQLTTYPDNALDAVRQILHTRDFPKGATLYSKGGSLTSDPVTRVQAGWYQAGSTTMPFAIMAAQPLHSPAQGKSQYRVLADLTQTTYVELQSAFLARCIPWPNTQTEKRRTTKYTKHTKGGSKNLCASSSPELEHTDSLALSCISFFSWFSSEWVFILTSLHFSHFSLHKNT